MTSDIITKMLGIGPTTVDELCRASRIERYLIVAVVDRMVASGDVCDALDLRVDYAGMANVWRLV